MKYLVFTLLFSLLISCSKKEQGSAPGVTTPTVDTSESLNQELLKKAKDNYELSKSEFLKSGDLKLLERSNLFLKLKDRATTYRNLLKQDDNNDLLIEDLKTQMSALSKKHDYIQSQIEKVSETKKSLRETIAEIKKIETETDEFRLTLITELGVREPLLESVQTLQQDSIFLLNSYPEELIQNEIDELNEMMNQTIIIEELFNPYFTFLDVLKSAELELSKVDFDMSANDHSVAALTHEEAFFKALEEYLKSIETFKSDASIFLNSEDLQELKFQEESITKTFTALKEMRELQKAIKADLHKVWLLGYDLPDNISELKEDQLEWKTKEVYVEETMPVKGVWQVGYHIAGPRSDARPIDHLTHERYYYKLVTPETYPAFDDAFGTAFTRIIMYQSKYRDQLPESIYISFTKINLLLGLTFQTVTDYIDSL